MNVKRGSLPIHKRLIGTWKSDKRKTLSTYKAYDRFSPKQKRRVAAIFGRLEIRYSRKFCYVTIGGATVRDRYDVIEEDIDSIVIRTYSDALKKQLDPGLVKDFADLFAPRLQHLHLETDRGQDYYWIGLRGLVEWFKKIPPTH